MQPMHGIMFNGWADPGVHLLLLKSSMQWSFPQWWVFSAWRLVLSYNNFQRDAFNSQMEGQDPESMSSDERWLLHLMKGKIIGKKKKPLQDSLVSFFIFRSISCTTMSKKSCKDLVINETCNNAPYKHTTRNTLGGPVGLHWTLW